MDKESAFEYRKQLLAQAHEQDAYFDDRINKTKETAPDYEIDMLERQKRNAVRFNLTIAKWNAEYWDARLAKMGVQAVNEDNEIVDPSTGLTAKELAAYSRVMEVMKDFNVYSNILEILDLEIEIPEKVLAKIDVIERAKNVIKQNIQSAPFQLDYLDDIKYLSRLEEFALKFYIDADFWHSDVVSMVEGLVRQGEWDKAKAISGYFNFINNQSLKAARKDLFYRPEDQASSNELFDFGFKEQNQSNRNLTVSELHKKWTGSQHELAHALANIPAVYFELDGVLRGARPMQSVFERATQEPLSRFAIIPVFQPDSSNTYKAKLIYYLSPNGSRGMDEEETRLEIDFLQDKKTPIDSEKQYGYHFFLGTRNYIIEKACITNAPRRRKNAVNRKASVFEYDLSQAYDVNESVENIDIKALHELSKIAFPPEKDFSGVFSTLDGLASKYEVSMPELNDLKLAIREFAKYTYPTQESYIGDCLTTPNYFVAFCRLKFKIEADVARYGENHPEWGSSGGYSPCTFFHEVNVLFGKIVIDWTVTQYSDRRQKPVPYIYEIGDEFPRFGPLFRIGGGETPNDPYPGTSLPEGYVIHYGI